MSTFERVTKKMFYTAPCQVCFGSHKNLSICVNHGLSSNLDTSISSYDPFLVN